MITREIQLTSHVTGIPGPEHFTVAEADIDGEVLVRTEELGLAATYLELMRADCHLPVPAWRPGQRVGVAAIGTVVRSADDALPVGQIAKRLGAARVIGSAGSAAKVDYLVDDLGFDAAFDYHDDPAARLGELAPEGISVFFDVVGGAQYDAALQVARPGARFALCGSLSSQLGAAAERFPRPGSAEAERRGVVLSPFSCYHTPEQISAWHEHFRTWLDQGRFVFPRTVVEGAITDVQQAFLGLLQGAYRGNVSVRLT